MVPTFAYIKPACSLPPQAGEGLGMRVGVCMLDWFKFVIPHPNPSFACGRGANRDHALKLSRIYRSESWKTR